MGFDGHNGLSAGLKRLKAKWRKEWEDEMATNARRAETPEEQYKREMEERECRLAGAERYILRSLAHIENKPFTPPLDPDGPVWWNGWGEDAEPWGRAADRGGE